MSLLILGILGILSPAIKGRFIRFLLNSPSSFGRSVGRPVFQHSGYGLKKIFRDPRRYVLGVSLFCQQRSQARPDRAQRLLSWHYTSLRLEEGLTTGCKKQLPWNVFTFVNFHLRILFGVWNKDFFPESSNKCCSVAENRRRLPLLFRLLRLGCCMWAIGTDSKPE